MDDEVVYIKLSVAIDKPIASLIKKLNKNNIITSYCCAGHKNGQVIAFDGETQINKKMPVDETDLYISFPSTDKTRNFLKYFQNYLKNFQCVEPIKLINNEIKYVSNFKEFNNIIIEEYVNSFVIRIEYNTSNFETNQKYCINFLTKILINYLKNNK